MGEEPLLKLKLTITQPESRSAKVEELIIGVLPSPRPPQPLRQLRQYLFQLAQIFHAVRSP